MRPAISVRGLSAGLKTYIFFGVACAAKIGLLQVHVELEKDSPHGSPVPRFHGDLSRPSCLLLRAFFSPFDSDGMPVGTGPDGMALRPEATSTAGPVTSKSNDLEFTPESVDKVRSQLAQRFFWTRFFTGRLEFFFVCVKR